MSVWLAVGWVTSMVGLATAVALSVGAGTNPRQREAGDQERRNQRRSRANGRP